MVKEIKPEKQALLSKGSGKGSSEGRVDIQVTAGQVRPRQSVARLLPSTCCDRVMGGRDYGSTR